MTLTFDRPIKNKFSQKIKMKIVAPPQFVIYILSNYPVGKAASAAFVTHLDRLWGALQGAPQRSLFAKTLKPHFGAPCKAPQLLAMGTVSMSV